MIPSFHPPSPSSPVSLDKEGSLCDFRTTSLNIRSLKPPPRSLRSVPKYYKCGGECDVLPQERPVLSTKYLLRKDSCRSGPIL